MICERVYKTYKWKLKFLCRVCMLYNELAEGLAHTVASTIFRDFVEVVVGKIKFISDLAPICS